MWLCQVKQLDINALLPCIWHKIFTHLKLTRTSVADLFGGCVR